MATIQDFFKKYYQKIDSLDLELIIAHVLNKSREFVLAHPEYKIPSFKIKNLKLKIARRRRGEPLAYILGEKEFYGLNFKVNKNVLIPRPETELLVEEVLFLLRNHVSSKVSNNIAIIDVGTGSGNIIISIAKAIENFQLIGLDISQKALAITKYNAKKNKVDKKIKFIQSDLLEYFLKNKKKLLKIENHKLIIVCNLPYLSKKIYKDAIPDVKNYEPKLALFAKNNGLYYYEKLFKQIKKLRVASCELQVIFEFSPEQKNKIKKLILKHFPRAKINFQKDLAGKWRLVAVEIK